MCVMKQYEIKLIFSEQTQDPALIYTEERTSEEGETRSQAPHRRQFSRLIAP